MKLLIIAVAHGNIGAIADESDGVSDEVRLSRGRQPELVVNQFLVEGEVAALADREESEAEVKVVVEARNHSADFAILLVDPERSGKFLRGVFCDAVGFGVR